MRCMTLSRLCPNFAWATGSALAGTFSAAIMLSNESKIFRSVPGDAAGLTVNVSPAAGWPANLTCTPPGKARLTDPALYAWGAEGAETVGGVVELRSDEHTSELQSLMRISYAVFCLKKKNPTINSSIH